uniref:Uncharacterized protein n=1 Tax=Odontella aurita TaxID=265563 RepID=A0A6U6JF09_9STRA|mmetsp:Transcript_56707/g.169399  ORF Transcript_56707/g.169399 Transcript_56707/m.169399 type:complete len:263 (+) Transcript_56707:126-914(+)
MQMLLTLIFAPFALIGALQPANAFFFVTPPAAIRACGRGSRQRSGRLMEISGPTACTRLCMSNQTDFGAISDPRTDHGDLGFNPLRVLGSAVGGIWSAPWLAPFLAWGPIAAMPSTREKLAEWIPQIQENANPILASLALGIGGGVLAYNKRVDDVSEAAMVKWGTLARMREAKANQLSSSPPRDASSRKEEVARAEREYESALRRELELRAFLPGIRVTSVPYDPIETDSEDAAAARQFLRMSVTKKGVLTDGETDKMRGD